MQREFHQRMLRPPPRLALDTRGGWPSTVFVCGPSLAEVIILGALVSQQGFSMRCAQHLVTRSSIGVSYRGSGAPPCSAPLRVRLSVEAAAGQRCKD